MTSRGCLAALVGAEITVHAVTADPDTAGLLEIPAGAAVFAIDRLTRLADGRPVDAESLRVRADRLALHARLHRGAVPPAVPSRPAASRAPTRERMADEP